jgi:hypothetical protein
MSKAKDDLAAVGCFTAVLLAPLILAFDGYVVWKLWGWFVVPLGVPSLAWRQAVGLSTLCGLLTHQYRKPSDNEWAALIAHGVVAPLTALSIGYLVSGFAR